MNSEARQEGDWEQHSEDVRQVLTYVLSCKRITTFFKQLSICIIMKNGDKITVEYETSCEWWNSASTLCESYNSCTLELFYCASLKCDS